MLLVLPDLTALRCWMAQDQRLSIAARIPIVELRAVNRRKSLNGRHGPSDLSRHRVPSAVHQHDIEHHELLVRVHPR